MAGAVVPVSLAVCTQSLLDLCSQTLSACLPQACLAHRADIVKLHCVLFGALSTCILSADYHGQMRPAL